MLTVVNEYHTLLRTASLKAAPEKTYFVRKKVELLCHDITPEGIERIAKRVKELKELKLTETNVMKVLGCPRLYGCCIGNLRTESQHFLRYEQ